MCKIQLNPLEILALREQCKKIPKGETRGVEIHSEFWYWLEAHYPIEHWECCDLTRCGVRLWNGAHTDSYSPKPNFTLRWKKLLEEAANCGEEVS